MEYIELDLYTGETVIGPFREYKSDHNVDTSKYPYQYDMRYDDDLDGPATIEEGVVVNYFGTVWLEDPLDMEQGYIGITDWGMVDSPEYDCPIHGKLGGIDECPRC